MTHRWLTLCVVMALGLTSGCGCQSRSIDGGDEGTVPGTTPAGAGGAPAPGPATGPAGPNINAGQDTGDGPAIPTGEQAVDPTPASYVAVIEQLAPPLEKETLQALADELEGKLQSNTKDPVAWCARATVAARQALHAATDPNKEPDLSGFDQAIEQAATHAGDGQWKYLVEHQRASRARLLGKAQEAVDHLKEAIKLQPAFVLGHVEYLQMMMLAGKLEEAEAKLHTLVKRWPGEWQGWFTLARCQIGLKKLPAAKGSLQEALTRRPDMLVLHESMLRIESLIFRERRDEDAENAVRTRFDQLEAAAAKHFTKAENLERWKRQIEAMREQFEISRAALLAAGFGVLPKERRTYDVLLGRLKNPNARRQMTRGIASQYPESEHKQELLCLLLEIVRRDETDAVRVDALRGLHQNLSGRSPRPWKESQREEIAAMCADDLVALFTNLDPAKDRAVLLRVVEAMGKLPVAKLSAVPECAARVAAVTESYLVSLDTVLAVQAKLDAEKDKEARTALRAERDESLKELDPLLEELQVLDAALQAIWGLGAPLAPDWQVPAEVKRWTAAWAANAAEVNDTRSAQGWKRAEKCK